MYEIGLSTITMTSKFVMTLAPIKEGDSFTIRSIYQTSETLTLQELNDIINFWDSADLQEILNRFKYSEELSEGFGVVKIRCKKIENIEFSESGTEAEKSFEAIITVEAVEDIAAGSILRL